MKLGQDILDYQSNLSEDEAAIGAALIKMISKVLPQAEGKVWHGHPVWFIDGNPVVGYSLKKAGIEVLFWSGQSFNLEGLRAMGKFKAASLSVPALKSLDKTALTTWLGEAKEIQWDYQNLPKKRALVKRTKF
ncbi:hypothetical protein RKACHI23_02630 [Rhodoluna lacicola]|jgi:Domain of unknown function (DU1801)|nr:DUF1801 domain-containing protein [Rhodoluna lacicola]BDS50001.1 hypothetical protein RKACHI23_02630 [Rhodoluna lacicola]